MPDPMAGESRDDFMQRCIPQVLDDGAAEDNDQAVAMCSSMFDKRMVGVGRAYSVLQIKSFDEEALTLEGVATTPTPDRYQDIVEPMGMKFVLPIPLLYQHKTDQPIGHVTHAKVTKDGITVKAKLAPRGIATFIDQALSLIGAGLVRGLSIGFKPLEFSFIEETGGIHFQKSEWLELSVVTIPAHADATITAIKSADALSLSGVKRRLPVRLEKTINAPGAPGLTRKTTMTNSEQITQYENKLAAITSRYDELIDLTAKEGRVPTPEEGQELDNLQLDQLDTKKHIERLRLREQTLKASAVSVTETATSGAITTGARSPITVTRNLPAGLAFARYIICLWQAKNNKQVAIEVARENCKDTPEVELVLKTEVAAGTTTGTTWAAPLMPANQTLYGEFLDLLRKRSILDRIPGLRYVPFNVNVPAQDGGATFLWVGETNPKPMSPLSFATVTLPFNKVAGIVAVSKELLRFSNPSAEQIVTNSMVKDCAAYIDSQLLLETVHLSTGVQPASLTSGVTPKVASGLTAAAFRADLATQLAIYTTANDSIGDIILAMPEGLAISMSLMRNALGQKEFPELTFTGGSIEGLPVIVSNNVSSGEIDFIKGSDVLVADGGVEIDMSQEASLVFTTTPASSPAATELVSLFQRNLVGIRVEKLITWKKGRSHSVQRITSAAYSS